MRIIIRHIALYLVGAYCISLLMLIADKVCHEKTSMIEMIFMGIGWGCYVYETYKINKK